jgi:hypothetical protein
VVSYLHPLHTEDIYVPARHGCVHEDVLAVSGATYWLAASKC